MVSAFRDDQYSSASFLFAGLLLTVPLYKWGWGTCPVQCGVGATGTTYAEKFTRDSVVAPFFY